jgi:chemotaxis protein CheD
VNAPKKSIESYVQVGRAIVSRNGILKATLSGSNLGIAFYWPERKISGLVHCLLPESPQSTLSAENDTRYVNRAIPALMQLMGLSKENCFQVRVWIAGGADLKVQFSKQVVQHVGLQNAVLARALLQEQGFLIETDLSGQQVNQTLVVNCETGEIAVS